MNLLNWNYKLLIMDVLFILAPFVSVHFGYEEVSYFFAGFGIMWIVRNLYTNKINFKRYKIGE